MRLDIPEYVKTVIKRLDEKGYEAYIVGGCVRDMLLGRKPKDYDVTTNASPDDIEYIFKDYKTIDIGKKFGTIIINLKEGEVEVTTYRKEGPYIDGRRPEWVSFSSSIEDDLSRRDFTINAIAYNNRKGIIDPFNGQEDISRKIIRTVGDPNQRFSEDYLRILRAVRFSSELDFNIDEDTFGAAKLNSNHITKVAMERIADEFYKILLCPKPSRGIRLMEEMGILGILLPEIMPSIGFDQKNPHHEMNVYDHILCVLDNTPPILEVRLAALFHDIGKPHTMSVDEEGVGHFYGHDKVGADIAKKVLKRFKASNLLIDQVYALVREHMNHHADFKEKGIKRLIRRLGESEIFKLTALQKADIMCSNKEAQIDHIIEREKKIREIIERKEAYDLTHLNINGKDLMELGFERGPIIGKILEYLLEQVMEHPEYNHKDILKDMALDKFSNNS